MSKSGVGGRWGGGVGEDKVLQRQKLLGAWGGGPLRDKGEAQWVSVLHALGLGQGQVLARVAGLRRRRREGDLV